MIGYIVREVAVWALVLIGLWFFYESYQMVRAPLVPLEQAGPGAEPDFTDSSGRQYARMPARILSAPPVALIGFVIFRGGIHLLKVAVAARAAQSARRDLLEAARRTRLPAAPRSAVAKLAGRT